MGYCGKKEYSGLARQNCFVLYLPDRAKTDESQKEWSVIPNVCNCNSANAPLLLTSGRKCSEISHEVVNIVVRGGHSPIAVVGELFVFELGAVGGVLLLLVSVFLKRITDGLGLGWRLLDNVVAPHVGHIEDAGNHDLLLLFFFVLAQLSVDVDDAGVLIGLVRLISTIFEASVPDLVNRLNLVFAELHPLEELGPAVHLLHGHGGTGARLTFLVVRAFLGRCFIDLLLSDVADALGNLDDLTHVHTRGGVL